MKKTLHFLSGIPRSGSTVLAAILNQNPATFDATAVATAQAAMNTTNAAIDACTTHDQLDAIIV